MAAADKIAVHHGDSRDVLKTLADNSIDACVCDPPYALVSISKRFGNDGAAPAKNGTDGLYARASRGFMGKSWDNGSTAFDPEFWREVLRVLKPGAHVAAFGGTRSFHRLACAIEDAGFEIRDQIGWCFGSGFPKSHSVGKAVDREAGAVRAVRAVRASPNGFGGASGIYSAMSNLQNITDPATDAAKDWEGWGTALKPAWEPICLARKPLSERTIAANVLRWGTGALNVDGCRIGWENDAPNPATNPLYRKQNGYAVGNAADDGSNSYRLKDGSGERPAHQSGRWPANLCHDGSDEVVAAFPEVDTTRATVTSTPGAIYGNGAGLPSHTGTYGEDGSGSAARFFFSAKADAEDRHGSKHPTVKPIDLMRWLCRLIVPPKGLVIDPFAGTGGLGIAAWAEGMSAILIEREAEYVADIKRRLEWASGLGPDRLSVTTKRKQSKDAGPLFEVLP